MKKLPLGTFLTRSTPKSNQLSERHKEKLLKNLGKRFSLRKKLKMSRKSMRKLRLTLKLLKKLRWRKDKGLMRLKRGRLIKILIGKKKRNIMTMKIFFKERETPFLKPKIKLQQSKRDQLRERRKWLKLNTLVLPKRRKRSNQNKLWLSTSAQDSPLMRRNNVKLEPWIRNLF